MQVVDFKIECLLCTNDFPNGGYEKDGKCISVGTHWYGVCPKCRGVLAIAKEQSMQYEELREALIGKALLFDHAQTVNVAKRYRASAKKIVLAEE